MQSNSVNGQPDIANITVVTDERQVIVPQAITSVVEVNNPGPQGPVGPQGETGPSVPFTNIGNDVYATTSSLQVTGSFLVSGSSTFTNIGPAIFSGSTAVSGSLIVNGYDVVTVNQTSSMSVATASYLNTLNQDLTFNGNLTLNGTASISTLVVNETVLSTGSNQLGDSANDTQTLYGSVIIPTGSLTVSGSAKVNEGIFGIGTSGNILPLVNTAGTGTVVVGGTSPNTPSLRIQGSPLNFFIGSTQVAQMFATTGNFALQSGGTFTDAGFRLDVSGSARVTGEANVSFLSLSGNTAVNSSGTTLIFGASGGWTGVRVPRYFETTGSISAASLLARGTYLNQTLVATANNDVLVALDIAPTFTTGAFTGVTQIGLRLAGSILPTINTGFNIGTNANAYGRVFSQRFAGTSISDVTLSATGTTTNINFQLNDASGNVVGKFFNTTGNLSLQNGGTFTDNGYQLQVNTTGSNSGSLFLGGTTIATGSIARTMLISSSLSASANSDVLVGLDIAPTFNAGAFTGVSTFGIRVSGSVRGLSDVQAWNGAASLSANSLSFNNTSTTARVLASSATTNLAFRIGSTDYAQFFNTTGNFLLQSGGTFTDAGYRLDVNGSTRVKGSGTTSATTALRIENTNASASLVVLDDGAVGIGTASPSSSILLDVSGSIRSFNILPAANGSYDLGVSANRFRTGWFAGSLIAGTGYFNSLFFGTTNFGIYNSTSTQIAQIFSTGDLVLQNGGTFTNNNYRLQVNATGSTNSGSLFLGGTTIATGSIARTMLISSSLSASANNDVLVGLDIQPTFTAGAFTGVQSIALRLPNGGRITNASTVGGYNVYIANTETTLNSPLSTGTVGFQLNYGFVGRFMGTTGNFILQNGGTFTDNGFRLDVSGSARVTNNLTVTGSTTLTNGQTTIQGAGATSATTAFVVRNSTPTNLLSVLDNGQVSFTSPTMSLAVSQSAFSISPIISASNVVGGQYYGVSITPTFFQTTGSQTETAFRVAATFTASNAAAATGGTNVIADFGSTSAGSQLTVTDVTSGSIYMVNDVSGIPIIEATSNWDVNIYDFPNKIFEKTGSQVNIYGTMRVSGSFILPLSQSVAPQTGSAYWSGSLLFIYDGTRYRSSSFA